MFKTLQTCFVLAIVLGNPLLGPQIANAQYATSNTPSVGCSSTAIGAANYAYPGPYQSGFTNHITPISSRSAGSFAIGDVISVSGSINLRKTALSQTNPLYLGTVTVNIVNRNGSYTFQQISVPYPSNNYNTTQTINFNTFITIDANDVANQGAGGLGLTYTKAGGQPMMIDLQHTSSCASLPQRPMKTEDQLAAVTSRLMETHGTMLSGGVTRAVRANLAGGPKAGLSSSDFFLNFRGGSPIRKKAKEAAHILGIAPIAENYDSGADEKLNIWLTGRLTGHNGAGFGGHSINAAAGIDYRFTETATAGVLIGTEIDNIDEMGVRNGEVDGQGITFGVYAGKSFAEKLLVDGMLSYSLLNYDVDDGTNTADVDADRITFALNLSGSYTFSNGIVVVPKLSGLYALENQDSYVDSGNNRVNSQTVEYGRVTAGARVSKSFEMESGLVMAPFLGLDADYEFVDAPDVAVQSGLTSPSDGISARVSAGFDAQLNDALSLAVEGDIGGIGDSDYTSYSARANVDWNF